MQRRHFLGKGLKAGALVAHAGQAADAFQQQSTPMDTAAPPHRNLGPTVFDPSRRHDRDFRATGTLERLSDNLYLYHDTANVYILRHGRHALLVGFGSGDVLQKLPALGVETIDRVLLTHHHRGLSQGLADLDSYTFQVTIPKAESRYFEVVEGFWKDVKLFLNYNLRSHWNTLRQSIPIHERVAEGDVIAWNGTEFRVLRTPGATDESVSYSAVVDGRRVVFTGDLIAGVGKVQNWFDLHWDYMGFTQGMDASEQSFAKIAGEEAQWLLPAHGKVIRDPEAAMQANRRIYARLRELLRPNSSGRSSNKMRALLPHLVHLGGSDQQYPGYATSYAILSGTGKALLYDYGYVEIEQMERFRKEYRVDEVTVVFSHYHDDHLSRVHELQRIFDRPVSIWVFENMADVLRNPSRYRLPCLVPFPILPTRVLRHEERVRWEGLDLDFFYLPGQTDFHQGLATTIDGKRVMFTGDNTWNKKDPAKRRNGPVIPQNEYFLDSGFIACAERMLSVAPDLVCPAHTEEYAPSRQDLVEFREWALEVREVMTELIEQPDANFGMDYRWAHFYPYRITQPGDAFDVELRLRNHLFRDCKADVTLKLPKNLICQFPRREVTIPAKTQIAIPFELKATKTARDRQVVTADILLNGRRMGEVTEFLIDF